MSGSIDVERLAARLEELARIGAIEGTHGCSRLAATDEDRAARDLVVDWMRALELEVTVDAIGNVFGTRAGRTDGPPVVTGSHVDTVARGGRYDGNLGVVAGLEVLEAWNATGVTTERPVAVGVFTNEEGVRFQPDMMGSGVHQGFFELADCLAARDADGLTLGDELARIGYAGDAEPFTPHAYVELHIEQGPVLEEAGVTIGAVTSVQGISWTELLLDGQANHAGTTPMRLRRDAGLVAAEIAAGARRIALEVGADQVATVGVMELVPGAVNVIPGSARLTVDLRNTDDGALREAEERLLELARDLAEGEGVALTERSLVRLSPVSFDPGTIDLVERAARALGHDVLRMPSGAGHDAQMFAPNCPTAMIFVPSRDGISHDPSEFTEPKELRAGVDVLHDVLRELAG